jgi:hypothetical protein
VHLRPPPRGRALKCRTSRRAARGRARSLKRFVAVARDLAHGALADARRRCAGIGRSRRRPMATSWYIRFTRFMTAHVVHKQEQVNSCGIACILMINFKMKKGLMFAGMAAGAQMSTVPVVGGYLGKTLTKAAVDYAVKTEPEVYRIYGDVVGTVYDGTSYTNGLKHPEVLNRLGLGNWECVNVGEGGMADAVKAAVAGGAPCIVHVKWDAGGAHFVCVDETAGSGAAAYAMMNDPGDGDVHPTQMTAGGTTRFKTGRMSGWIVRRK